MKKDSATMFTHKQIYNRIIGTEQYFKKHDSDRNILQKPDSNIKISKNMILNQYKYFTI